MSKINKNYKEPVAEVKKVEVEEPPVSKAEASEATGSILGLVIDEWVVPAASLPGKVVHLEVEEPQPHIYLVTPEVETQVAEGTITYEKMVNAQKEWDKNDWKLEQEYPVDDDDNGELDNG